MGEVNITSFPSIGTVNIHLLILYLEIIVGSDSFCPHFSLQMLQLPSQNVN